MLPMELNWEAMAALLCSPGIWSERRWFHLHSPRELIWEAYLHLRKMTQWQIDNWKSNNILNVLYKWNKLNLTCNNWSKMGLRTGWQWVLLLYKSWSWSWGHLGRPQCTGSSWSWVPGPGWLTPLPYVLIETKCSRHLIWDVLEKLHVLLGFYGTTYNGSKWNKVLPVVSHLIELSNGYIKQIYWHGSACGCGKVLD